MASSRSVRFFSQSDPAAWNVLGVSAYVSSNSSSAIGLPTERASASARATTSGRRTVAAHRPNSRLSLSAVNHRPSANATAQHSIHIW